VRPATHSEHRTSRARAPTAVAPAARRLAALRVREAARARKPALVGLAEPRLRAEAAAAVVVVGASTVVRRTGRRDAGLQHGIGSRRRAVHRPGFALGRNIWHRHGVASRSTRRVDARVGADRGRRPGGAAPDRPGVRCQEEHRGNPPTRPRTRPMFRHMVPVAARAPFGH
jgi:hypothetical protein